MSTTPRRAILLLAIVALLGAVGSALVSSPSAQAGSGGGSTVTATSCTAPAATAARLRIRVTSSAPQVDVHLKPTYVTGRKDVAVTGGAASAFVADGVRVQVPAGTTGTVEIEVIAVDPTRASALTLSVDKVGAGSVTVKVWNPSGYGRTSTISTSGTTAQTSIERARLFDPTYALPKADDRKLVLAAYYPWFGVGGWDTLLVPELPAVLRSVWNLDGVRSMTRQARDHGVDGFVVSWMGAAKNGVAYDLAAQAAAETHGVVAPYLEVPEALAAGGVPTVEQWLREAVARTGPASLEVDGVPVVFVWDMGKVAKADWSAIVGRLGRQVLLVGDANTATHGPVMSGWHAYLPPTDLTGEADRGVLRSAWFRGQPALDPSATPKLHVTTVSPGFDDRLLRGADRPVVSREGGRYDATWDAALAADPDMVLITSWNEWFEGSNIEPGVLTGDTALRTTAERAAEWQAGTSSSCTEPVAAPTGGGRKGR